MTLLSLALTPLTITASLGVIILWWNGAKKALFMENRKEVNWIILGVVIGFSGSMVDNIYWGLAWTADYLQLSVRDSLFHYGVYSNTPFRQVATIIAGLCHVRAGMIAGDKVLKIALYSGAGLGVLFTCLLLITR